METVFKVGITIALSIILFAILPYSPFNDYLAELAGQRYIAYLCWFFPVGKCIQILISWGGAITIFYSIQWVLRQFSIIR